MRETADTHNAEFRFMVVCDQTGDTGYCDTPEEAAVAARTLLDDAWAANAVQGFNPTISFFANGFAVRVGVPRRDVLAMFHKEAHR